MVIKGDYYLRQQKRWDFPPVPLESANHIMLLDNNMLEYHSYALRMPRYWSIIEITRIPVTKYERNLHTAHRGHVLGSQELLAWAALLFHDPITKIHAKVLSYPE